MQGLLWEDLPSRLPALLPEPLRRAGTRLPCAHADLLCCGEGLVFSPFYALFLVFWPVSVESLFAVCHYTRACNERGENVDLGEHLRWHPDWLARFRHIRTPPPPACAIRHPSEPELLLVRPAHQAVVLALLRVPGAQIHAFKVSRGVKCGACSLSRVD